LLAFTRACECVSVRVNPPCPTADTLPPCPTARAVPLILCGPSSVWVYQCVSARVRACVCLSCWH